MRYDESSKLRLNEDLIVSQMRTVISAGYETVSAIIAVYLYYLLHSLAVVLRYNIYSGCYMRSRLILNSKLNFVKKFARFPIIPSTI